MKKKYIYILILVLSLNSCEFSISTNIPSKTKNVGLRKMPKVKSETFENLYVADEKLCKEQKLHLTRFAIEYPNGLEIKKPKNGKEHIGIAKKINGIITEELSIGTTSIDLSKEKYALKALEDIAADFKKQLPKLEIITISKKSFNGEMNYVFEGQFELSGYEDQGYGGNYKMMFLIPIPKKDKNLNSVTISFIANEQSEIKEFSDFSNKGMIGSVYKTFRYLE